MRKLKIGSFFRNDRFLKVFSVLLAIICWVVVTMVDSEATITVKHIPIQFDYEYSTAGNNGLQQVDMEERFTDVRVKGKSYVIGALEPEDFVASAVLTNVTKPGVYDIEIKVEKKDRTDDDYTILYATPNVLRMEFDRVVKKTFSLDSTVENITVSEGYFLEKSAVLPDEITVTGPEKSVKKIARCAVVNQEKLELEETTTINGELVFYDAQDSPLTEEDLQYISYEEEDYQITVPVYVKKDLELTFDYINIPSGLDVEKIHNQMDHKKITVGIPVDAASDIDTINVGQIDFRKLDRDSVFTFDISLPSGYLNLDKFAKVSVSFPGKDWESTQVSVDNILLSDVPANYSVDILTEKISDIRLVGLKKDIAALTSSDVVAVVDLSNDIAIGDQNLEANVRVIGDHLAWAIGDYSVLVHVEEKEA